MNLKSVNNFFEKFWLIMGIGTLLYGIYYVSVNGVADNYKYLLLPFFAFFLWYMRRRLRLSLEKRERVRESQELQDRT